MAWGLVAGTGPDRNRHPGLRIGHRLLVLCGPQMAVTSRLQELRAGRQWTQAQLATEVGVSRQTINSIETGRFEPSLTLALKLARLFGTTVDTIFALPDA